MLVFVLGSDAQDIAKQKTPSITLREVGGVPVLQTHKAVLTEAVATFSGDAWNCQEGDMAVLLKPYREQRWRVARFISPRPGGIFLVDAIRFREPGEYSVVVALFKAGALAGRDSIDDKSMASEVLASSRPVEVSVASPSRVPVPSAGTERPAGERELAILSVGRAAIRTDAVTPVESIGDVVVFATKPDLNAQTYLAVHVPNTDVCYLRGPGSLDPASGNYVFPGVSFEVPGNPLQVHLDLVAFESSHPVRPGRISWEAFRREGYLTSRSASIFVESKPLISDTQRVPFLEITRIDKEDPRLRRQGEEPVPVHQGGTIEVSAYERLPEGPRLWVLTRPRGTDVWLAQGPMEVRGSREYASPDAARRRNRAAPGPTAAAQVSYVWTDLRFESLEDSKSRDYEVKVVLSGAIYPNAWISSTFSSLHPFDTVSQVAPVKLDTLGMSGRESDAQLTISQVSGKETGDGLITPVGKSGSVLVEASKEMPKGRTVFVCSHPLGVLNWSCVETIQRGVTHIAPDIPFSNPHERDGTIYQLVALTAIGPLHLEETDYPEIMRHARMVSNVATVRYTTEASGWNRLSVLLGRDSGDGQPPKERDMWPWWVLITFIALLLALLVAAWLLERTFGVVSTLAGGVANTFHGAAVVLHKWLRTRSAINFAGLLLGLGISFILWYVVTRYYVRLYTAVLEGVTGMPAREASGLAVWLIVLTALLGVFIDLAYRRSRPARWPEQASQLSPGLYKGIAFFLGLIALLLWIFEGGLYYQYLENTSAGMLPLFGGMAFFMISAIETIALFFVTDLALETFEWFVVGSIWLLLATIALMFRAFQRMFEPFSENRTTRNKKEPAAQAPPGEPAGSSSEPGIGSGHQREGAKPVERGDSDGPK